MKNARAINPSDIRLYYFGSKDVLNEVEERLNRKRKLERAMVLTNCEHQSINILMQLPSGETLEIQSSLIDYAEDFVLVKGGYAIPVSAIVDVDI